MKLFSLIIIVVCGLAGRIQAQTSEVSVSESETLSPRDLNMHKYVFEATPTAEQVVIIRKEEFRDGKLYEINESVAHTMGKPRRESIVLIDRSFFSDPSDNSLAKTYQFAGVFNTPAKVENARLRHLGGEGNGIGAEFDTPKGRIKFVFTMMVEAYSEAKKRIADLPTMTPNLGWTIESN